MKKMILMFALLSLPAFATDIPYTNDSYTSSTCDSGVLQHDSGTVRLRARYEPNTINIRWYNNNTEITPANTAANTCDYDSTLILPANEPTRTGYTFAGWHVRPLTDFASLGLDNGLEHWGKGHISNTTTPFCYYAAPGEFGATEIACDSDSHFTEMNNDEWQVRYDDNGKTLYGTAHCSKKRGDNNNNGWSVAYRNNWQTSTLNELDTYNGVYAASDPRYCWCKATGYKINNNSQIQGSQSSLAWVFLNNRGTVPVCTSGCANACAHYAQHLSVFRSALFAPLESTE